MRLLVLVLLLLLPRQALAGCAPVAFDPPHVWRAAASDDTLTITFLGHASFEIETPAGVRAVTDYNGFNIPADPPDIATMNHAHATHYTLHPDPRIRYVLHGWQENGVVPAFDLVLRDLHVTNLPSGQPTMTLHGGALRRLQEMTPPGFAPQIAVSLTDEYPYAYANVIISVIPL